MGQAGLKKWIDKHHKPHVHVYYGECEAAVSLDGEVLEGKLPLK